MAEKKSGLDLGGNRVKAVKQALSRVLPEWQVFIRRPNGTTRHITITRDHQLSVLGGVAAIGLWAAASTLMLTQQPQHLANKERELEELMAANRAAQHRLASAEKMVGQIAREVDLVQANVAALAESNSSLAKDNGKPLVKIAAAKPQVVDEPAYDDANLTGGAESKAVREQVRRLEAALERLRGTTSRVVNQTASAAGGRIEDVEKQLSRLGLDPERLVSAERKRSGQGGPFVPAPTLSGGGDNGLGRLMERMDYWSGMKAAVERLPLAQPIRADYDLTSTFGRRRDPLNERTGVHEGIDMAAPKGTPVQATGVGVVSFAGTKHKYGQTIDIDHGNGVMTRYAHLSRIKVKVGQKVTRSTVIGLVGNTGRSTGPHLHYEVRLSDNPRDPLKFIRVGRNAAKAG